MGTLFFSLLFSPLTVFATSSEATSNDVITTTSETTPYDHPVQSNDWENWPKGPSIHAEAAIVMEADTGTILYAKDIEEKQYPASITKILTTLVVLENSQLNEEITYSYHATHSIDPGSSSIARTEGEILTVEESLYGLMLASANECANALAEHVAGSSEAFAELMNAKAKELGCTDSNFITPNGIHDENHYTSAHDMALIAQAFFSNEMLAKMSCTTSYHVPQTATQPREDMIVWAKSKLLPGKEYEYEHLIGTKTGYTDDARQTLVSCAQKDGMKLVCVILKEETPSQFTDTIELFNYGFDNFYASSVAENDTNYSIDTSGFFSTGTNFFGSNKPILQIDPNAYIVIPDTVDFMEVNSSLTYENLKPDEIARINYSIHSIPVGSASLIPIRETSVTFDFGTSPQIVEAPTQDDDTLFINIKNVIVAIMALALLLIAIFMIRALFVNTRNTRRRSRIMRKYKSSGTKDLDWRDMKPF
jgi:D-alanyl-D-alanine carboxypeptidase